MVSPTYATVADQKIRVHRGPLTKIKLENRVQKGLKMDFSESRTLELTPALSLHKNCNCFSSAHVEETIQIISKFWKSHLARLSQEPISRTVLSVISVRPTEPQYSRPVARIDFGGGGSKKSGPFEPLKKWIFWTLPPYPFCKTDPHF